jgi:hypothetical protein
MRRGNSERTHESIARHYQAVFTVAVPTGLEPAISCVTGRHVNHYTTGPILVAGAGFEPATFGL